MFTSRNTAAVVGLDIEAGSVAAAQVVSNGSSRLQSSAIAALEPGIAREGEVIDPTTLGATLKQLFAQHKLSRNVRVGVANQRVIVRTMQLPKLKNDEEIDAAVRFAAPDKIPMPLDEALMDWQVVDPSPETSELGQMDVVVVAARRETVSGLAEAISQAGLKMVGIDIAAFGMIRALEGEAAIAPPPGFEDGSAGPAAGPARLLCSLGDVTNLAVARDRNCLFTRVSPFGVEGIAQRLAERRELTLEHARQWLLHVGLETPLEQIEGDPRILTAARETLEEGVAKLAGEIRLSLDYYGGQETAVAVEEIVACGPGIAIAGLPERLERELGLSLRAVRPQALGHLDDADAARLTVSYGLGMEE